MKLDINFIEKATQDNTWVAFLFIIGFLLVAILRNVFEKKFKDYVALLYNNKYIKLYSEGDNTLGAFSLITIVVQLISFSLFFLILLSNIDIYPRTDWFIWFQIFGFLTLFIGVKYFIEKGIAQIFEIKGFYDKFIFRQISYKTYTGNILLFVCFIMYYTPPVNELVTYILFGIFIAIQIFILINTFVSFRKEILNKLFYFILYLCTLEIAPYYFMYYLFTKQL
ncbi:MAG: DUF4271 domain-containing protein [Bacteroidota bacterium]|nr:DUF4271 domain-containing protein [Bacteroidota bacterium]